MKTGTKPTSGMSGGTNGGKTTNFANFANGGCPGRAERHICVYLCSFAVNIRPENGDLDRKWTQMDANGGLEQPKTGKWHENSMGKGRKLRNSRKTRKMGLKMLKNSLKMAVLRVLEA